MDKKKHIITKKSVIYSGHSSCIYKGEINKKICAIKSYFDKESLEFQREIEVLKRINHHNVIKPLCIFKNSIVTLNYGQNLRNFIKQKVVNLKSSNDQTSFEELDSRITNKTTNAGIKSKFEAIFDSKSLPCENQLNSELICKDILENENQKNEKLNQSGNFYQNLHIDECVQNEKLKITNKALIKQLIDGIKYLHAEKIIHFDLKPENIIISDGILKIIDFGSAKYENETILKFNFTNSYTSLEYLLGCPKAHYFQDIWSLGCIMFELITGRSFISSNNTFQAINQILKIFGSPDKMAFLALEVKHTDFINIFNFNESTFKDVFKDIHGDLVLIFKKIFDLNPLLRISASEINIEQLPHTYF